MEKLSEVMRSTEMAKRWTVAGDNAKKRGDYDLAVSIYLKAFSIEMMEKAKYLIPRISACYRRMGKPRSAINFYKKALEKYGEAIMDRVVLTAISSVYSDLKYWDDALECADQAAYLNDGVVDEYLDNVYDRIHRNNQ